MTGASVTWTPEDLALWLDALIVSRGSVAPRTARGRAPHGASVPLLNGIVDAFRAGAVGDECFVWPYGLDRDGYGNVRVGKLGSVRTHRYVLAGVRGPLLRGEVLDHTCRNRACLNPLHLEPVTNAENILRGEGRAALNAAKTECIKGHPFDAENTRYRKTGGRACRACERERHRASRSTAHSRASVTRAV